MHAKASVTSQSHARLAGRKGLLLIGLDRTSPRNTWPFGVVVKPDEGLEFSQDEGHKAGENKSGAIG